MVMTKGCVVSIVIMEKRPYKASQTLFALRSASSETAGIAQYNLNFSAFFQIKNIASVNQKRF
jgi:hypothetical protein